MNKTGVEEMSEKHLCSIGFLIIWELFGKTSTNKKEIQHDLVSAFERELIEWKIEVFDALTFTPNGEIVKAESGGTAKLHSLNMMIGGERAMMRKYFQMELNVVVTGGNSLC